MKLNGHIGALCPCSVWLTKALCVCVSLRSSKCLVCILSHKTFAEAIFSIFWNLQCLYPWWLIYRLLLHHITLYYSNWIGLPHRQTPDCSDWWSHLLHRRAQHQSPQGCAFSPLMFTLYTNDCSSGHGEICGWHHHHWPDFEQLWDSEGKQQSENNLLLNLCYGHHVSPPC